MVFTPEAEFPFKAYVFYNNLLNKETAAKIQAAFLEKEYIYNNVSFGKECFNLSLLDEHDTTYILRTDTAICTNDGQVLWGELSENDAQKLAKHLSAAAVKDSGEVYAIFNDQVCQDLQLGTYLRINRIEQLNPDQLNQQQFCQTWLTDLSPLNPVVIGD
jgi:hypothetical protein